MKSIRRRDFLRHVGNGLAAGATAWPALGALSSMRASAEGAQPQRVSFSPEMEAVVRWMERTPREKALSVLAEELRKGLPYRQLLGGLFLAGIRNIKPRPVGFKFHAVMVMQSAHQLALDAPRSERLYPFFWAFDNFKASQDQDVKEGDWTLEPVKESSVPSPTAARKLFAEAMEKWDAEAADAAVAGLCRGASAGEIQETLWPLGARDWSDIGHKAIFTAHAFRTLDLIGWENAEPVLRSLVFGLLDGKPGENSAPAATNRALLEKVRPDWLAGKPDPQATLTLLEALRKASPEEAAREAAGLLDRGAAPDSLWDAILVAAADLLLRSPGIVSLHAVTSANALHHIFRSSGVDATRLLVLFQAASWSTFYREALVKRNSLPPGPRIESLEALEGGGTPAAAEIFRLAGEDRPRAMRTLLAAGQGGEPPPGFFEVARRLVFTKGTDSHHYKFAAAIIEEFRRLSPAWRGPLLAASLNYLPDGKQQDSPIFTRTREALGAF